MSTSSDHEGRLTAWWSEHRGIFLKIARSFTSAPVDEADLVQEMLVQLWRSLPRFREQCAPSTWIYRVALNTALGSLAYLLYLKPAPSPKSSRSGLH